MWRRKLCAYISIEKNGSQTCFESIVKNNEISKNYYEIKTMPNIIDDVGNDENGIGYAFYSYFKKMQLEYGKAPLSYTNGIPTYKAGEWEGILPCKFHSCKRVIRPLDQGIIVNNNPVFYPKKKVLIPSNSPEFIFKPSFKVTNIEFNLNNYIIFSG